MKSHGFLKTLIEQCVNEEVDLILAEQEPETGATDQGDAPDAPVDDLGDLDSVLDMGETESSADADAGGLDLGDGEAGAEGEESPEGEDEEMDLGGDSDFGGGGTFGGGGGFGGGMSDAAGEDPGDEDKDAPEEEDAVSGVIDPEDVGMPEDPIQSTVDIAVNMLGKTGDDSKILGAVKASLQRNFENFDDAVPIIQQLWDTENPTLKVVARKLLLFIQGR